MPATLDVARLRSWMKSQHVSQTELVIRSGVSRAQLSRLLSRDRATVRMGTISKLAHALALHPTELTANGQRQRYLDWVAEQHEFIDFRGIGMPHLQRQRIEDVFVEPEVESHEVDQGDDENCLELRGDMRWRQCHTAKTAASDFIRKSNRLVVLGNPGSGKTTLLRWLAFRAARGDFADIDTPIYVRLVELSRALEIDPTTDVLKFISSLAVKADGRQVEQELRARLAGSASHCLVLFDGLDEVGDPDRRHQLIKSLVTFLDEHPRNRFVLTSRVIGFEPNPWNRWGFSTARLLGYGDEQLMEFSDKWSRLLAKFFGRKEASARESLSQAILGNPRLRALASNPLTLTILALLNESRGGTLPRRRVDLYGKVAEVFLETWERTKQAADTFDETSDIDLDGREFGWLLSDMALAMQKNNRTLAARWWLNERVQDCLRQKLGFEADRAKDVGERVLQYLTLRTGLIEERGIDQFGFSHRTMQEYFAAAGVKDEADASPTRDVSERLRDYYFNPHWTEVVRLVAASVTPPVAESMISTILDDPDPLGRDLLRRGPMLAVRCLSDGATVPDRKLVAAVFDSLTVLGRSKWLGVTLEALQVLETLAGTRLELDARRATKTILEMAEHELSPDEYVCLHRHAHWREVSEQVAGKLGSDFNEAARELTIQVAGRPIPIVCLNATLRVGEPRKWFESLCSLVRDDQRSKYFRQWLIRELGRQTGTHTLPRRVLRKLIESNVPADLRAEAAEALGTNVRDTGLKLRVLRREDEDLSVRRACASSLCNAAVSAAQVATELVGILKSDNPDMLRAGAARGLATLALKDPVAARALLDVATEKSTTDRLKCACMWGLRKRIGTDSQVKAFFAESLAAEKPMKSQRMAAQILAQCMSDESLEWDHETIGRIQSILMALDSPCPHALASLVAIATARQLRADLRLESVLRDALKPVAEHVEFAFVFGSTARRQQTPDSDIDLMVIGDLTHKMLASPLREAERTLGRRINAILNSTLEMCGKIQSRDAFVLEVYRGQKIPVWPGGKSRRELDDELRAMVSEWLASAG
ncbi:MAG: NACHT domain-containing protein [Pirellulaceae bacterium]|nr:NACHT domain-containing protein [Pirellulaceae bacterium]